MLGFALWLWHRAAPRAGTGRSTAEGAAALQKQRAQAGLRCLDVKGTWSGPSAGILQSWHERAPAQGRERVPRGTYGSVYTYIHSII